MTQQFHFWAYTLRKPELKKTHVPERSMQHHLQQLGSGSNLMSISRWMDKEVVVYIYNRILFSLYKKECIWVSSNKVDEPRAYYTEWSKSERERQILHINAYIWNLERWYQWSYINGSKGDPDVKKRLLDSVGKGEGGMIWENTIQTYTLSYVKQTTSASLMHEAGHPKLVLCDNLEG